MHPELFTIGNLTVYSYGLMIALGVLISALALYREAPGEKMNPDHVLEAVLASTFFGLIGARLLYVMLNWDYFSANPGEILFAQFAGLSFYGGLFLGVFVLFIWTRWRRLPFFKLGDLMAPYLALGYAFGRLGCFLNGCCYGRLSDLPWAMPAGMIDDALRQPVQLYAALGSFFLFAILRYLRPRRPFDGFVLLSLFPLYGLLRFSTEFFRQETAVWLGLSTAQIFSLALILVSVPAIFVLRGFLSRAGRPKKGSKKRRKGARR